MKLKRYALALAMTLSLCATASAMPSGPENSMGPDIVVPEATLASSEIAAVRITTQTAVYSMEMTNVTWYQKAALFILGLDWEEITIVTIFSTDKNTGNRNLISVHAWPSDIGGEDEATFHLDADHDKKSFMYFLKYTQFRSEEIPKLLKLFLFLHDDSMEPMKFSAQNLFEKGDGSMHCELLKRKSGYDYVVDIKTLNASGNQNGKVEVTVDTKSELFIKKIYAELKVGPKITLTLKDWRSETDWR